MLDPVEQHCRPQVASRLVTSDGHSSRSMRSLVVFQVNDVVIHGGSSLRTAPNGPIKAATL